MIARYWKGTTYSNMAQEYIHHLKKDTFPKLEQLNGFQKVELLRKSTPIGTEFLVITYWDSLEHIQQFAGENIDVAVVPPAASQLMVSFDKTVSHYEVI